jgi:hypothetical protein
VSIDPPTLPADTHVTPPSVECSTEPDVAVPHTSLALEPHHALSDAL